MLKFIYSRFLKLFPSLREPSTLAHTLVENNYPSSQKAGNIVSKRQLQLPLFQHIAYITYCILKASATNSTTSNDDFQQRLLTTDWLIPPKAVLLKLILCGIASYSDAITACLPAYVLSCGFRLLPPIGISFDCGTSPRDYRVTISMHYVFLFPFPATQWQLTKAFIPRIFVIRNGRPWSVDHQRVIHGNAGSTSVWLPLTSGDVEYNLIEHLRYIGA